MPTHPVRTAVQLLRDWLKSPRAAAHKRRAAKVRDALRRLPQVKPPQPVPDPTPDQRTTVQRVVAAVRSQVGYHEGRSGGHWNNVEKYAALVDLAWVSIQHLAWCCVFTSWAFKVGGLRPNVDFPLTASCDAAAAWYKSRGRFSEYPALGAQLLYQFGAPGDFDHTGVVVAYTATTVTTVEGNTNDSGSPEGDGVYLKVHPRTAAYIVGYGYPDYPEGIVSADPKWKGRR